MVKRHILIALSMLLMLVGYAQPTVGLLHTSAEAFPSYTLFSNNEETYLIDNCGLIVNQWHSEYRPGRALLLLDNGDLLRTAEQDGAFPISGRGGRFERFNWEGELLWSYEINDANHQAHHDICLLPNGNFLALVWEKRSAEEAHLQGSDRNMELWTEAVYEIKMLPDNQAEIVWQWQLWDHLVQDHDPDAENYSIIAASPQRIDLNYREDGTVPAANWVHLNAIDYHAGLDQILLSSRLFSEVWVIDHSTTTQEARLSTGGRYDQGGDLLYRYGNPAAFQATGPSVLKAQHDAQWVNPQAENSALMVFNNEEGQERSAIKKWQPPYLEDGSYAVDGNGVFVSPNATIAFEAPWFYSPYMSSSQQLPDDHLFICSAADGHFFEINEQKEIVWEYLNPVNPNGGPAVQGATLRFNQTFAARKYALGDPAFSGRDMSGMIPVEINPLPSDCFVPQPYTPNAPLELMLSRNPIGAEVWLTANREEDLSLACFNMLGQLLFRTTLNTNGRNLDFSNYPAGIYLLYLQDEQGAVVVKQLVKV
jgi:hypothetical protein